ncbi:MAG: hypothetical protein KDA61_19060, partial [Planctomycetales bacterium]|nr:hypothetical protein [Planctomycetales bacterium]
HYLAFDAEARRDNLRRVRYSIAAAKIAIPGNNNETITNAAGSFQPNEVCNRASAKPVIAKIAAQVKTLTAATNAMNAKKGEIWKR